MASFFPQTFRDIDVIRLNNITVFNANNTLPSTGTVLTVSSGKAYMLPITTALEAIGISSLSTQLSTLGNSASNWSYYPALSTVNMNLNNMSNFNKLQGQYCIASGEESVAIGFGAVASGDNSIAFNGGQATGLRSFAFGGGQAANTSVAFFGTASGEGSVSLGGNASGFAAIAFGGTASGPRAFSIGNATIASGPGSFAEGDGSKATENAAHAEGVNCIASGSGSHAEGSYTRSSANSSHSEGYLTYVAKPYGHAEGEFTQVQGQASHAEGFSTIAGKPTFGGSNAHAEGYWTIATGSASHSQGSRTEASAEASFAAGVSSIASNFADTVIGYGGRSRIPINFVLGGGPVLNAGNPIYGAVQNTSFNLTTTTPENSGFNKYPLYYYTDYATSNSSILFETVDGGNPVAFQYTVKLTGYQQPVAGVINPDGSGIFYGEYTFLTYLDSHSSRPTLLTSDGAAAYGPNTDIDITSIRNINKFSGGLVFDTNISRLYADIDTVDGNNILILNVYTASLTKANWIAQVERSEIALPY